MACLRGEEASGMVQISCTSSRRVEGGVSKRRAGRPEACSSRSWTVDHFTICSPPFKERLGNPVVEPDDTGAHQIHDDGRRGDHLGERRQVEGGRLRHRDRRRERARAESFVPQRTVARSDVDSGAREDSLLDRFEHDVPCAVDAHNPTRVMSTMSQRNDQRRTHEHTTMPPFRFVLSCFRGRVAAVRRQTLVASAPPVR